EGQVVRQVERVRGPPGNLRVLLGDLSFGIIQVFTRCLERYTGLEPADRPEQMLRMTLDGRVARDFQNRHHVERLAEKGGAEQLRLRRQHADDRARTPGDRDATADDRRVAAEAPLPVAVAK